MRKAFIALLTGIIVGLFLFPIIIKAVQYSPKRLTDNTGNYVGSGANPIIITAAAPTATPTPSMPTFVSAGANISQSNTANFISVPAPAGIITSDLIVTQIQYFNIGGTATITPSPGVWTQIRCDKGGASSSNTCLFWHLATGSGDGPWTFTSNAISDYMDGRATAFRGANLTTPVDVNAGTTFGALASLPSVSVTPTVSNGLLATFWAGNAGSIGGSSLDAALTSIYLGNDGLWTLISGRINAPNAGVASSVYTSVATGSASGTTETINIRP